MLLPHYEPYAAAGVLINEIAVFARGEAAARDIADARFRVKLDGILLPSGIDETQGVVVSLYDVQGNLGSFRHEGVVQSERCIGADQGRVSPVSVMLAAVPRGRAMGMLPVMVAVTRLVGGMMRLRMRFRMRMWVMTVVIVFCAAGEHTAYCEKGDGCGEFLPILPCEHINPSCRLARPVPFVCIIPKGHWRMLRARLKWHKIFGTAFLHD